MAKAKQVKEEAEVEVKENEIIDKEKQEQEKDKRLVYIGTNIRTPYIVLNRFTTLLDKPKNYEELIKKSKDLGKLFVTVEFFGKNIQQIKASNYYKELTKKVQKELGGK